MSTAKKKTATRKPEKSQKNRDVASPSVSAESTRATSAARKKVRPEIRVHASSRGTSADSISTQIHTTPGQEMGKGGRLSDSRPVSQETSFGASASKGESLSDSALFRYVGLPLSAGLAVIILGLIVSCAADFI